MRPGAWLLFLAAAAAVAWVQLAGVSPPARIWAVILLVPLPALLIAQARRLAELEALPRTPAYLSSIASLWLLAGATLAVARASGYDAAQLGLVSIGMPRTIITAAIITAAAVAILFLFRAAGMREAPVLRELLPATPLERTLFAGVSITAGICEEIVFRGFLIHVLYGATASLPIALLLSSGAFGVSHAYQQPAGALRAALLGLLLALPLLLYGSIVPAIIAHAAVDLLSGLWLARYLLRS